MKKRTNVFIEKKIFFVLLVLAGVGLIWVMPASARSDGRKVVIGSNTYKVKHNGNGPYVKVSGKKYYLGGEGKKRNVVFAGKTYFTSGRKHHHHDDHHDNDD